MRVRLDNELKAAMVARDQERLLVLRSLKSDLKYREVELNRPLTDDEVLSVFKKAVKSREQSIELYEQGKRTDLADKERREIVIIHEFLPAEITPEEIDATVDRIIAEVHPTGMKDMGAVMKKALEALAGRADGKAVSDVVRKKLAG